MAAAAVRGRKSDRLPDSPRIPASGEKCGLSPTARDVNIAMYWVGELYMLEFGRVLAFRRRPFAARRSHNRRNYRQDEQ